MNKLRVRMYRQGLGDSFLLTYWADDEEEPTHLLIDSGVLKGTEEGEVRMREVAENVRDETGGQLDILVATHEHWDHVSGFLQAQEVWDGIDVGEVWVAWTEDPQDELAAELRKRKKKRLQGLAAAAKLASESGARRVANQLDALLGFEGELGARATKTTAKALEWVKGRDATIRYLRPGEQLFDFRGLRGIRVFVLGPPHDRRLIKRSDPSKRHPEVYELAGSGGSQEGFLAASEALAEGQTPATQPFDPFFRVEEKDGPAIWPQYFAKDAEWRRVDHDWLGYAGAPAPHLHSDTNNTSLVLAFELASGGGGPLFPGDAQGGNRP